MSVKEHKQAKGLKSQNLRDHMSEAELIFTALAELSTRQIAEATNATGMTENQKVRNKRRGEVMNILISGTASAKKVAGKTLEEVRDAVGLRYFD